MTRSFYVTTPIYYVNADPHIGHAYTSVAADVVARWRRLCGDDVRLQTGTDEHGLKIEQAARQAGISPQAKADRHSVPFRRLSEALLLSDDDFIRTTEPRHQAVVADLWRRMVASGDLYKGTYAGWYSVADEAFYTETELVEGRAPSGSEVVWTEESTYFFRLSKYGHALLEHLRANPGFVRPESRYNEVVRFVEAGLNDLSISRTTFTWGVPVPEAPGHVVYVWLDALANYVSALGGPGAPDFERYWPADLHLIGKDILRFHAVYWPCFLMSLGLALPRRIFAHGWWLVEGTKMSKSLGNALDPFAVVSTYGAEPFRFFLLREVAFGNDGDYSEQGLRNRINGDLANDFGNLVNRTLGMVARYREGVVPPSGPRGPLEEGLIAAVAEARVELHAAMDDLAFHRALAAVWRVSGAANKYVDEAAPWTLARQGAAERLDTVLYTLCEVLRVLGVWTTPVLPRSGPALLDRLSTPAALRDVASTERFGALPAGLATFAGDPLFPRLDDPAVSRRRAREAPDAPPSRVLENPMNDAPPASAPVDVPATPEGPEPIDYSLFAKLDLRVARVVAAERVPKADRLLQLTVDAGEAEHRTILSGIAEHYSPEEMVGRTVVLLANLKPRKIRGVMSNGMLLAAGEETVRLLDVPGDLPPGTKIS
jgi:methionyl-tRNA synthetase